MVIDARLRLRWNSYRPAVGGVSLSTDPRSPMNIVLILPSKFLKTFLLKFKIFVLCFFVFCVCEDGILLKNEKIENFTKLQTYKNYDMFRSGQQRQQESKLQYLDSNSARSLLSLHPDEQQEEEEQPALAWKHSSGRR